jgi:hypothetical protein
MRLPRPTCLTALGGDCRDLYSAAAGPLFSRCVGSHSTSFGAPGGPHPHGKRRTFSLLILAPSFHPAKSDSVENVREAVLRHCLPKLPIGLDRDGERVQAWTLMGPTGIVAFATPTRGTTAGCMQTVPLAGAAMRSSIGPPQPNVITLILCGTRLCQASAPKGAAAFNLRPHGLIFPRFFLLVREVLSKERKGARRPDQILHDALTDLRENGRTPRGGAWERRWDEGAASRRGETACPFRGALGAPGPPQSGLSRVWKQEREKG